MLLLAFDTATPAVTVAVLRAALRSVHRGEPGGGPDGAVVLAQSDTVDARRHGELLAPAIRSTLADAGVDRRELDAIAVGVGPGPFTGLRVGVTTARVLGAVLALPVHGVCTLDAIALGAERDGPFLVATDARRREVYWAAYDGPAGDPTRVDGPHVSRPADVPLAGRPVLGEGAAAYPDLLGTPVGRTLPAAADLGRWVLQGRPVLPPAPLYLRRPDAAAPGQRKRVLT